VQRAAHLAGFAFGVERAGDLERLGIDGHHGMDFRTGAVESGDAVEAHLGEFLGGQGAGRHGRLKFGDARLVEFDRLGVRGRGGKERARESTGQRAF
jgi:hypothetical protein